VDIHKRKIDGALFQELNLREWTEAEGKWSIFPPKNFCFPKNLFKCFIVERFWLPAKYFMDCNVLSQNLTMHHLVTISFKNWSQVQSLTCKKAKELIVMSSLSVRKQLFLCCSKIRLMSYNVRISLQLWWEQDAGSFVFEHETLPEIVERLIISAVSCKHCGWLVSQCKTSCFSLSSSPLCCLQFIFCTALHSPRWHYAAYVFADGVVLDRGHRLSICHIICWQIDSSDALPPTQEALFLWL